MGIKYSCGYTIVNDNGSWSATASYTEYVECMKIENKRAQWLTVIEYVNTPLLGMNIPSFWSFIEIDLLWPGSRYCNDQPNVTQHIVTHYRFRIPEVKKKYCWPKRLCMKNKGMYTC